MDRNQQKSKREIPKNLPSSLDKEFWAKEAVTTLIDTEKLSKPNMTKHFPIVKKGPYFICRGCPFEHSIPLDPNKWDVKDGRLVKKKK